ncbi:MAG: lipoyl(octanoyl) transferase LipB [Candidatus Eisenbacteria bacterium]|nr:lipoyl(octanoyl) transferase LipB [Candidatus Latescibacterota bacterium]MBD3302485.1 lipoyl(octanoyl) transferase LipB [Candidatus Eisenbacteria bacterium]
MATRTGTPAAARALRIVRLDGRRGYEQTWDLQRRLHAARCAGDRPDTLLLLEHEPVVTIGRNGREGNLVAPEPLLRSRGIDLVRTDRGGDVTYHGPGQLIGYAIVDLKELHHDVHRFLREMEEGMIRAVARFGIEAGRREGKTGVWVGGEKLASIGLRASRWVTMHGFALNVATDLAAFDLIVPCGIPGCRMTSMERLTGARCDLDEVGRTVVEELAGIWNRRPELEEDQEWRM